MAREIRAKMYQPPAGRSDGFGIDHWLWIATVDGEGVTQREHSVFPIPLTEFRQLLEPMSNSARIALYKQLIMTYFNTTATPAQPPTKPSGLTDLDEWEVYWDADDAFTAQKAADVAECASLAQTATNWIESLGSFDTWENFYFTLQEAS